MLQICVILLLFHVVELSSLRNERHQIIEHVRKYLQQSDSTTRSLRNPDWLINSNKIGFGYNLLAGSPVCYTGACQMDEFTRSIFKLNYSSPVPGSCTDKFVPNNVELDCLPSGTQTVNSEVVDTIENLHASISNKVDISTGAKFRGVGFSYTRSKETRHMLDNIINKHRTSILTAVEISYAKLSMFEPKMELSDNFRYVIDNIFCCEEDDPMTEEYVKDFIFDYFGVAYVTSILLGGVAQQNIFIDREAKEKLERNSIQIKHQAVVSFDLSMGSNIGNSFNVGPTVTNGVSDANYNMFKKEVKSMSNTKLGGVPDLTSFAEWSKTVSDNPVIIKLKVRDIFRLFTKHYFPDDPMITNKSKLIEKIFEKYITSSVYCDNNCGGNDTYGTCQPTGFFQYGVCQCKPEWTGSDCKTAVIQHHKILHGTICGFDRPFIQIKCGGTRPWDGCPTGWIKYSWRIDLTICYKNQTVISNPFYGTICGLHSYHSPSNFSFNIGCNDSSNVYTGKCPTNYQLIHETQGPCSASLPYPNFCNAGNAVCAAVNVNEDSPGTLCGMQIEGSTEGPSCDGFNPGLRQCPPNYTPQRILFNYLGFMVCVKTLH
ncbi:unnamed protein product [Rotaria sp. Silwood2]|nr:unnamed protein product [Rotaria sp. Silwood2]